MSSFMNWPILGAGISLVRTNNKVRDNQGKKLTPHQPPSAIDHIWVAALGGPNDPSKNGWYMASRMNSINAVATARPPSFLVQCAVFTKGR
ncbi:MAG: hypothetical protein M2R46_05619 [Verrucomicrobia subdivision 3 bacterium]|nr:hypothetical protein [Limisphaerales bacterium]